MTDVPTNEFLDRARATARRNAIIDAGGRLTELDLGKLLSGPAPAIDWAWDGYFERGTVGQIHGNGGAGKSILAAGLVRAAAGGYPFLGRNTWPSRSIVIDGENGIAELHRRLERLDYRSIAGHVHYWQASDAIFDDLDEAEEMLCTQAEQAIADLLILDSQRALWYGLENDVEAVRPFYSMLRRVATATGVAVLVLHHDNRSGSFSGSSDLNAAVDSRLHLTRNETGLITLTHEKLRSDIEQPPVNYRLHLEGGQFTFSLQRVRTERDDILEALDHEWHTATEIAKAANVRRELVEAELNQITRAGDAQYAEGPPGRHSTAFCWRLPPNAWDNPGQPALGDSVTSLSPDLHTPEGGEVGTSSGREVVPSPDKVSKWVDPVDADLELLNGGDGE